MLETFTNLEKYKEEMQSPILQPVVIFACVSSKYENWNLFLFPSIFFH
jgi:hypothetical protein